MIQGYQGDFVTVDVGHDGCQPWPAELSVTSPISVLGMPTDFTSDASGAAVQPSVDYSKWANLITVTGFKPSFQPLGCTNWIDHCGNLAHTFPIIPAGSTVKAPEAMAPMNDLLAYTVSVDMTSDKIFQLDTEKWFRQNSRVCCLKISAMLSTDNGDQPLPPWLSLYYNLTHAPSGLEMMARYTLKVYAQPGVAAVGNHTIRILANDESLPDLPAASVDLHLLVIGKGPTIVGQFPAVEVADGQPLQFAIPDNVIQLNKPYGRVSYSAEQQAGLPLPAWLSLAGDGNLRGTANPGLDTAFNLSIAGSDSDGAQNSTSLMLYVRAACPAGLYRHFRLQISPDNDPGRYDQVWSFSQGRSAICSVCLGILRGQREQLPKHDCAGNLQHHRDALPCEWTLDWHQGCGSACSLPAAARCWVHCC